MTAPSVEPTSAIEVGEVGVPVDFLAELFSCWVGYFAERELGITQNSTSREGVAIKHTFGAPDSPTFSPLLTDGVWALGDIEGLDREVVHDIAARALDRVREGDPGEGVVYVDDLSTRAFTMAPGQMLHFMRMLGDQVLMSGRRRLGTAALLDFSQDDEITEGALFVPPTKIRATLFVPGPRRSFFTDRLASGLSDTTAAICAVALGNFVERSPMCAPLTGEGLDQARNDRNDWEILNLARDSVSLDIFGELFQLGGFDAMLRVRGSLLSYHAALEQSNADVVVMLMVTAIEALLAPSQPWAKDNKVTTRFIKAVTSLAENAVDEAVNHRNCEEAFGYRQRGGPARRRRELLDRIYELRSNPTHLGLNPLGTSTLGAIGADGSMRAAILSDLARNVLLAFLQSPRSFLVGHPVIDPPGGDATSIDLTDSEAP